ncbi:MAG: cytochrome c [Polaribacter sp.]
MKRGQAVYKNKCVSCHMANGKGIPRAFPPLAESDYLMSDVKRSIDILLNGLNGKITVNGVLYNGSMIPYKSSLSNKEIADVLNYIRNSWGNSGDFIKEKTIDIARKVKN